MLNVNSEQLDRWRSELADYPGVVRSLNEIEDCDGDVQDAAINLALHAGMEPDNNDAWLLSLAKRYRTAICQCAANGNAAPEANDIVRHLVGQGNCPELLALPIAIAAKNSGLEDLCRGVKLVTESDTP